MSYGLVWDAGMGIELQLKYMTVCCNEARGEWAILRCRV
jgi:hypothetical protein